LGINCVGVVGLGSTGAAVARRLVERGFGVTVYDRDPARVAAAVAAGARPARIPADAAESADLVFVRMPDEAAVTEALFDCGGVGDTLPGGAYVVDASSTGSAFARSTAARLAELQLRSIEAWFVRDPGQDHTRVFAGCTTDELAAVTPLLGALTLDIVHVGPVGSVAALRLMLTALHAVQSAAVAEAVAYAERAGLDRQSALRGLADSFRRVPVHDVRRYRRRMHRDATATAVAHIDVRLAVADAAHYGVDLALTACAANALSSTSDSRSADRDPPYHRTARAPGTGARPERSDRGA
jgi:3-hydroxyisobutyrate dehydrogenase